MYAALKKRDLLFWERFSPFILFVYYRVGQVSNRGGCLAGRYSTAHETLGEILYHIWRRPYIHEYASYQKKEGFQGFGGLGALTEIS
jgi:hypothetical protein